LIATFWSNSPSADLLADQPRDGQIIGEQVSRALGRRRVEEPAAAVHGEPSQQRVAILRIGNVGGKPCRAPFGRKIDQRFEQGAPARDHADLRFGP
jgi:hypothetical protein